MAENNPQTQSTGFPPKVLEYLRVISDSLSAKGFEDEEAKMEKEISKEIREIRKRQDKYGRLSYVTARSWKDFGNRLGNNLRLALTKSYVKSKYGWGDEKAARFAQRWIANGNKGLGVILTKIVPAVGLIANILNSILKMLGERGQYLKSTSMLSYQGGLSNPAALFRAATLHAGYVNNPLMHSSPLFAASDEYKNAYRAMLESGVFAKMSKGEYKEEFVIRNLITSFDYIAAQGKVLGRSFQETAQLITSVGSQFFIGRGFEGVKNFGLVNDVLQSGRIAGFNDANIIGMLTNYSKINAYSNNGIFLALNDIAKFVQLISNDTNGILDKANPQQIASQIQSAISMNIPFSNFIALTQGLRSFGRSDFTNLVTQYRETSQFGKLASSWETLRKATNTDYKTLMTIAPSYFGGLQGDIGEEIINLITSNKNIFSSKDYENLSFGQALAKFTKENPVEGKDAAQIQMYAQQQLFFEQPLQTIIGLLVSMLQSVVQIGSVVGFAGFKKSPGELLHDSMANLQDLNKFNSGNSNIGGA